MASRAPTDQPQTVSRRVQSSPRRPNCSSAGGGQRGSNSPASEQWDIGRPAWVGRWSAGVQPGDQERGGSYKPGRPGAIIGAKADQMRRQSHRQQSSLSESVRQESRKWPLSTSSPPRFSQSVGNFLQGANFSCSGNELHQAAKLDQGYPER